MAQNLISQAAEASVASCVEESTRSSPAEAVEAGDAAGMALAAAPAHGLLVCAAFFTSMLKTLDLVSRVICSSLAEATSTLAIQP